MSGRQKTISLFIKSFLILMGVLMIETTLGKTTQIKEVTVGIAPYYQPFEYQHGEEIVGFDVDLIHVIAKELDWKITLKAMPFEALIPALKQHDIDLAISGINMIPERLKEIDFSQSYHQPHSLVWVYLSKSPSPLGSMETLKVGVQTGTYLEEWVNNQQKIKMNIQAIAYGSTPELFEKLQDKEVDTIVVEEIQAKHYNEMNPGAIRYETTETMIEGYGVAFPKGSLLTKDVNNALQKLVASGKIKALQEKWIP